MLGLLSSLASEFVDDLGVLSYSAHLNLDVQLTPQHIRPYIYLAQLL